LTDTPLGGKAVLVTGAAKRIGQALALASARAGADVILHYHSAAEGAQATLRNITDMGRRAWLLRADFAVASQAAGLMERAFDLAPVYGLVNSAAIFSGGAVQETGLADWDTHLAINLTAPFLLTQSFAKLLGSEQPGRVVNLLDWRAMKPGADHFAYTVSKAALAAMTRSLAQCLAPNISVNGLALGAILPPGGSRPDPAIVKRIPAGRWGNPDEVGHALVFLLAGTAYVTGEIIYIDGGRHLL
jgi:NAD(P)-dependent dehydrogenase (short-subunit alcohol dehydrogenase family)